MSSTASSGARSTREDPDGDPPGDPQLLAAYHVDGAWVDPLLPPGGVPHGRHGELQEERWEVGGCPKVEFRWVVFVVFGWGLLLG